MIVHVGLYCPREVMMRRSILFAAVACALAAPAAARHIQLEGGVPEGLRRFVTALPVTLSLDGDKPQSWQTVTRTGTFYDPRYGEFEITRPMLLQMVENFDKGTYGQDIFIDVSHEPSKGSAAKVLKLAVEGNRLRALLEWTPYGVDAVKNRGFRYLSADYHEDWQDNEKRAQHGAVLFGAGLTIRPVIKHLDPVQLSEPDGSPPTLLHPELQTQLLQELHTMWKDLIKKLSEQLKGIKLGDAVAAQLITLAEAAVGKITDAQVAQALITSFEEAGKKLAEEIAKGGNAGDIKIQLAMPDTLKTGMDEAAVKKLMETMQADAAKAAKTLQEDVAGKRKLLADTITAAQGLTDELKKELTESVADLVTETMTDEQVKKLATVQIEQGNKRVAAQKLSDMGFMRPAGSPHISVDDSNSVKALQETVDKRLGFDGLADAERYTATGGKLQDKNKKLVEKVLAGFDASHASQLRAEHKMLAAGDGLVSDVAVPAIFERTVIREALYQLVGLQFVDVGTYIFSASALIPYSYRDTTAAGRSSTRVYEGGSIARAGVKQTSDTAYPIPQKLAFEVSDELRYLTANGQIDWDAVVENVRNASRIIGEDTEKLIFDEVLNAADQYASTAVVDEATATGDAAKTIFKLDNFPVVRPKKIYDLQGNQIGSTLYPIVVTVAAAAKTEYDGTGTQAAGLYWTMDYNLGEIHFVDELGAPSAPAGAAAIVVSYTYTTNVYAFDTDLGAAALDDHWNTFLYRYGLRKAVIESDRFHSANFGLMSMTAMTQAEQAKQFSANFARPGTDLSADGNLGRIKAIPNFKSTAPGLNMGDQRIIIGERGMTRFRMMKPWAMGQMQDQKDANGRFTGKKEAYGDQFIVLHTPTPLKAATTSMVLYSATARVDR
jgi:hypothetical protein